MFPSEGTASSPSPPEEPSSSAPILRWRAATSRSRRPSAWTRDKTSGFPPERTESRLKGLFAPKTGFIPRGPGGREEPRSLLLIRYFEASFEIFWLSDKIALRELSLSLSLSLSFSEPLTDSREEEAESKWICCSTWRGSHSSSHSFINSSHATRMISSMARS